MSQAAYKAIIRTASDTVVNVTTPTIITAPKLSSHPRYPGMVVFQLPAQYRVFTAITWGGDISGVSDANNGSGTPRYAGGIDGSQVQFNFTDGLLIFPRNAMFNMGTASAVTAENYAGSIIIVALRYFPLTTIAGTNSYSVDLGTEVLEDTSFDQTAANGGFRTRIYGLTDASVTLEQISKVDKRFQDKLKERARVFLEIAPGGGSERIRGYFIIENANMSGEVSGLEMESITLQLDGEMDSVFSWS